MTTTAAGVVVLLLAIGDNIHGFVDFKQPPNTVGSRVRRRRHRGLVSAGEWKLTTSNNNSSDNNNGMNYKQEMESSFVQSRGGRNYDGDVIPPTDWNTNDNNMTKENRPTAPLITPTRSLQERQRGEGRGLFFAASNEIIDKTVNDAARSSRKGAVGQALQWGEEDNRWERTRRHEDNMWERARRKAIQQQEEEDARNDNNILSSDASETGIGQATKSTTMTTSKKGSSKIVMIYEATKRSEMEGIDQARIIASTVEKQKDENESSMVKIDELGAENIDTAVPIQKDVNTKEFDNERVGGVGGGLLSNWWGRLLTPIKTKSLYDVLDCPPDATREQLKRSYLSLARETHPDAIWQKSGMTVNVDTNEEKNNIVDDNESKTTVRKFTEISHAWKILSDSSSRQRYDRELQARGVTDTAVILFEGLVMGAARTLDVLLKE